jgi:hypothetical protein
MEQAEGPVRTKCFCPGTPHEEDVYHLVDAEHLPIDAGVAAATALSTVGDGNAGAVLIGALLRHGAIRRWNLVDADGDAVPINPGTVGDRLTWVKGGIELANASLERYVLAAGAPFGSSTSPRRNGKSSSTGQTARSTSRRTRSSSPPREPSASSLPASSDGSPSPESQ